VGDFSCQGMRELSIGALKSPQFWHYVTLPQTTYTIPSPAVNIASMSPTSARCCLEGSSGRSLFEKLSDKTSVYLIN
jgi:hypothetical protein